MKTRLFTAIALFLPASLLSAHEGHGTPGQGESFWHYVAEPMHLGIGLLAIATVVCLSVAGYRWMKHRRSSGETVSREAQA